MNETLQSGARSWLESWSRIARRIRVPMGFVFAVLYVWLAHPTVFSIIIGVIVLVPGLLLRALASGHVQKNEQLTTSGPYAYTRNPLYLGSLLLAAGFAVAARSWWIVVLMVFIFTIIYIPVIAGEERFLRQSFPEFDDYACHVPRLWPRMTRFGRQKGRFSSALYWKHREYNAMLGSAVVLVVLIVKLVWKLW